MSSVPRVLAVDDDLNDRRLIQRALRTEFEIISCGSGEEGLIVLEGVAIPEHAVFDVLISDYHLPGISGIEFMARAAQLQPDAGRLMITGDPNVDRTLLPVVTLFKPVPMDALRRFVGQLSVMSQKTRAARARASRPTDPTLPAVPKLPPSPKKR